MGTEEAKELERKDGGVDKHLVASILVVFPPSLTFLLKNQVNTQRQYEGTPLKEKDKCPTQAHKRGSEEVYNVCAGTGCGICSISPSRVGGQLNSNSAV